MIGLAKRALWAIMNVAMTKHLCACCGAPLEKIGEKYQCPYCGSVFEDDFEEKAAKRIAEVVSDVKMEALANAKRLLYNASHAQYISHQAISEAAFKVLSIDPDDILAGFYIAAIDEDPTLLNQWLRQAPLSASLAHEVIDYELRSMEPRNVFALKDFAERQLLGKEQTEAITAIENEAAKLDAGLYNPSFPRDIFLCYSSRDQARVVEICDLLEDNGFTVFAAYRNLRHGRGAAENYLTALHQAMKACRVVVFLSSKNSRSAACDALRVELPFINANCPKMGRVEYILDSYEEQRNIPILVRQLLKDTFEGLEWCKTPEDLVKRVFELTSKKTIVCPRCGHENEPESRFCHKCGEPLSEEARASVRKQQAANNAGDKPTFAERMKKAIATGVAAIKNAAAQNIADNSATKAKQDAAPKAQSAKAQPRPAAPKPAPKPVVEGGGAARVFAIVVASFALLYTTIAFFLGSGSVVVYGSYTELSVFTGARYFPSFYVLWALDLALFVLDIRLLRFAAKRRTEYGKAIRFSIGMVVFGFGSGILLAITLGIAVGTSGYSAGANLFGMIAMYSMAAWTSVISIVIYAVRNANKKKKK